ncbi:MAG: DUF4124 domain-containing protein [Betaproteobacteria bacterium]|nr:DUF4124 domain-containing protein [Betaproteobacteria bacterium]
MTLGQHVTRLAPLLLGAWASCVLVAAPVSAQQVYKWVGADGVTHYGERPPAPDAATPLQIRRSASAVPQAAADVHECHTIQCQYERLRADRLIRDAEWRKDMETRSKLAEARRQADAPLPAEWEEAPAVAASVYPLAYGRRVFAARPVSPHRWSEARSPARRSQPAVSLRMPGER